MTRQNNDDRSRKLVDTAGALVRYSPRHGKSSNAHHALHGARGAVRRFGADERPGAVVRGEQRIRGDKDEMVTIANSGHGELYLKEGDVLYLVTSTNLPARGIGEKTFLLHGHKASTKNLDGSIIIEHDASEAKDCGLYTIYGIEHRVEKKARRNHNEMRTKLGVGECVFISALPRELFESWQCSHGKIFSENTASTWYDAPGNAAEDVIVATTNLFPNGPQDHDNGNGAGRWIPFAANRVLDLVQLCGLDSIHENSGYTWPISAVWKVFGPSASPQQPLVWSDESFSIKANAVTEVSKFSLTALRGTNVEESVVQR